MSFKIKRDVPGAVPGTVFGTIEIVLTDEELAQAYFESLRRMQEKDRSGDWKQWVADVYHCSGCWGQKMTDEEMLLDLAETRRQADPDDYVPDIMLYHECATYWNSLCDVHPN